MVEKWAVLKGKTRHVGTFDFKETYRVMFEWLWERDYVVNETKYIEILKPNGLKEIDVFWDAWRKISDYFVYLITVRFHPLAMTKIEVEIDGVKQKVDKGDFTIEYSCAIIKDYTNKWGDKGALKTLRNLYDKTIQRERIEKLEVDLITDYNGLIEYSKDFLALMGRR